MTGDALEADLAAVGRQLGQRRRRSIHGGGALRCAAACSGVGSAIGVTAIGERGERFEAVDDPEGLRCDTTAAP